MWGDAQDLADQQCEGGVCTKESCENAAKCPATASSNDCTWTAGIPDNSDDLSCDDMCGTVCENEYMVPSQMTKCWIKPGYYTTTDNQVQDQNCGGGGANSCTEQNCTGNCDGNGFCDSNVGGCDTELPVGEFRGTACSKTTCEGGAGSWTGTDCVWEGIVECPCMDYDCSSPGKCGTADNGCGGTCHHVVCPAAKCSSVAATTVDGWLYDATAADVDCAGAICEVQNGEVDQDTCYNAIPTCFDKVKNQDETGVDCGGTCIECTDVEAGSHAATLGTAAAVVGGAAAILL